MEDLRLLVVVAHPDDETFGCGSILLHAAARGATTTVCCATRGEAGEPAPNSGVTAERLPAAREAELRAAADVLGVSDVVVLDYRDSGMGGEAEESSLVGAPFDDVVARVGEVIARVRPDIVVTLDGSDGHRDHVRIRDATLAAVDRAGAGVQAVYLHCLPRSVMRRWADLMRELDPSSPYLDVDEAALGTPDEEITTVVDTAEHYEARWEAIRCHVSQTSPYDALPEDLRRAFLETDHLRRVRPAPVGEVRGVDILEGIEPPDR